jgi:hypothetical protein
VAGAPVSVLGGYLGTAGGIGRAGTRCFRVLSGFFALERERLIFRHDNAVNNLLCTLRPEQQRKHSPGWQKRIGALSPSRVLMPTRSAAGRNYRQKEPHHVLTGKDVHTTVRSPTIPTTPRLS